MPASSWPTRTIMPQGHWPDHKVRRETSTKWPSHPDRCLMSDLRPRINLVDSVVSNHETRKVICLRPSPPPLSPRPRPRSGDASSLLQAVLDTWQRQPSAARQPSVPGAQVPSPFSMQPQAPCLIPRWRQSAALNPTFLAPAPVPEPGARSGGCSPRASGAQCEQ